MKTIATAESKRVVVTGTAVPVRGDDVDTDRIIPARYLKEITFERMGDYLFRDVRFDDHNQKKDHPLNNQKFSGASILIAGRNFGCGSSREHAPQAIMRFGLHAIIGKSFAEIFSGNCKSLGIPAVTASEPDVDRLFDLIEKDPQLSLMIDLNTKTLKIGSETLSIDIAEDRRQAFLTGQWDSLKLLLHNREKILETAKKLPYVSGYQSLRSF